METPKKSKRKVKAETKSPVKAKRMKLENDVEDVEDRFKVKKEKSHVQQKSKLVRTAKSKLVKGNASASNCEDAVIPVIWLDHELLADVESLDFTTSENIVRLFDAENTIPFIARYRQELTKGMNADRLRDVRESYELVKEIRAKAESLLKTIAKNDVNDENLILKIKSARSLDELHLLAAPFKKGSKASLAMRAKEAGLEEPAIAILNGSRFVDIPSLVNSKTTLKEVMTGLQHVIADVIAKDTAVLDLIANLKMSEYICVECAQKKSENNTDIEKYQNYFNFNQSIRNIREHQVLAINRGEAQKCLSVKINVPQSLWDKLMQFCKKKWLCLGLHYDDRTKLFATALRDAIHRLLSPLLVRQIRSTLTKEAERSSVNIFNANLKNLLLTAPLRGKYVMAIDPGIKKGCKVAVVSPYGQPLHLDKIYITDETGRRQSADSLARILQTYKCEIIALGNGTFCRETETFLSNLIQSGHFLPLDVSYTIVDEQGVSIYSCSADASQEFPGMDPTLISAVSLARRLQDPLAELVKVEPKHLGVGMYQHDVPEKKLSVSLEEVVSECVSFVGVDINTASLHLLRRVAGLNKSRAEAIAVRRLECGPFTNREELLKVKGIGKKTFEQCAGFVRIIPATAALKEESSLNRAKEKTLNALDNSEIHPEDYKLVYRLLAEFELDHTTIGSNKFCSQIRERLRNCLLSDLGNKFDVNCAKLKQVTEALTKPADDDLRSLSEKPLFRRGVTTFESIKPGDLLSGVVRNVVQFGAFVDVGVGVSGLLHSSVLGSDRSRWVKLGDKVNVKVLNVSVPQKRIGLRLASS